MEWPPLGLGPRELESAVRCVIRLPRLRAADGTYDVFRAAGAN